MRRIDSQRQVYTLHDSMTIIPVLCGRIWNVQMIGPYPGPLEALTGAGGEPIVPAKGWFQGDVALPAGKEAKTERGKHGHAGVMFLLVMLQLAVPLGWRWHAQGCQVASQLLYAVPHVRRL